MATNLTSSQYAGLGNSRIGLRSSKHDFVNQWISFVLANRYAFDKNWHLIEKRQFSGFSNIISWDKKLKQIQLKNNHSEEVIVRIHKLVFEHCVKNELTLSGFFKFLYGILEIHKEFPEAFGDDAKW